MKKELVQVPYDIAAEQSVIGACLIDKSVPYQIAEILKPDDFYREEHQAIITAIYELVKENKPVDIVSVVDRLKSEGKLELVGGGTYVARLANAVPNTANAEYYANIVKDKSDTRKLIKILSGALDGIDNASSSDNIVSSLISELIKLQGAKKQEVDFQEMVKDAVLEIMNSKKTASDFPTGYGVLDKHIKLKSGTFNIIAARPGVGKTALATNIMLNIADKGVPCLFISIEMSAEELVYRIISTRSKVMHERIENKVLSEEEILKIADTGDSLTREGDLIHIVDSLNNTVEDVLFEIKKQVLKNNIKVVFIDYLQLLHTLKYNSSRVNEISYITTMLKQIARETGTALITLSQLSRRIESREDKVPNLADLRESGSIEQDADTVTFLYYEDEDSKKTGTVTVKIAKNRNGPTGIGHLLFLKDYLLFTNEYGNT